MANHGILMVEAKTQFELGVLTTGGIHMMPMGRGWSVSVVSKKQGLLGLVDKRKREIREFRTADAALAALREIGFKVEALHLA